MATAVPAVLLPRRHPEPRGAGGAGLDPRGRRAGLLADARLRRGVRQPGPGGRLRDRRRRGGDRAAGRAAGSSNVFLNPARDGAVLPILHLNGYKIANPTVLARIPEDDLLSPDARATATSRTWSPATTRPRCTSALAATHGPGAGRDRRRSSARARSGGAGRAAALADDRPAYAEGLDRPAEVDGVQVEGTFRAHQVPLAGVRDNPEHLAELEQWLRSLPAGGAVRRHRRAGRRAARAAAARRPADERQPARQRRPAAARPGAARLPRVRRRRSPSPGEPDGEATRVLGRLAPRRDPRQPRPVPAVRPGRGGLQPARRRPSR